MTDGVSTWSGPYGRLREIIGNARADILERVKGDYAIGYTEALNMVELEITNLESEYGIGEYSDENDKDMDGAL